MWAGSVVPVSLHSSAKGRWKFLFFVPLHSFVKGTWRFPCSFSFFFFCLRVMEISKHQTLALFRATGTWKFPCAFTLCCIKERGSFPACTLVFYQKNMEISVFFIRCVSQVIWFTFFSYRMVRGTQRHISENICSEDDLRSRILGTFVVKFLACLPLLEFSNI